MKPEINIDKDRSLCPPMALKQRPRRKIGVLLQCRGSICLIAYGTGKICRQRSRNLALWPRIFR
jgi:hypothetical protein